MRLADTRRAKTAKVNALRRITGQRRKNLLAVGCLKEFSGVCMVAELVFCLALQRRRPDQTQLMCEIRFSDKILRFRSVAVLKI